MKRRSRSNPRSNSVFFPVFAAAMGGLFWVCSRKDWSDQLGGAVALTLLSLIFFGTAAAQLRSGYLWQNLAPGSRGLHRSKAPRRFLFSNIGNITVGIVIITFAWCRYANGG